MNVRLQGVVVPMSADPRPALLKTTEHTRTYPQYQVRVAGQPVGVVSFLNPAEWQAVNMHGSWVATTTTRREAVAALVGGDA